MSSLADDEKVFHPLNAVQRAGIRRVESSQEATSQMFLHCSSMSFHFMDPATGREIKWRIEISIEERYDEKHYRGVVVDGDGKPLCQPYYLGESFIDSVKFLIAYAGECVARQRRS